MCQRRRAGDHKVSIELCLYIYAHLRFRILWPNDKYAIALADLGSALAGTKARSQQINMARSTDLPPQIQLASSNSEDTVQHWHLLEHEIPPSTPASSSAPPPQTVLASPPVETVVVSGDRDFVTTTRTTTTSTVTTVTTVTKAPRAS